MFLRQGRAQPRSLVRRLPRSLPLLHAVADAGLGEDVAGVVRVVAQLAAQPPHDVSHRRGVLALVRSPDPLQQALVGQLHAGTGQGRELGLGVHAGQGVDGGAGGTDIAVNLGFAPAQ